MAHRPASSAGLSLYVVMLLSLTAPDRLISIRGVAGVLDYGSYPMAPNLPPQDKIDEFVFNLRSSDAKVDSGERPFFSANSNGMGSTVPLNYQMLSNINPHKDYINPTAAPPPSQFFSSLPSSPQPSSNKPVIPMNLNLTGKVAFIAGVADSNGFGWSILKSLYGAGATVVVGSWAPMALRFEKMLSSGALDNDRIIDDFIGGSTGNEKKQMLEIKKVYPLDVSYDGPEDIPEDVKASRRFSSFQGFSISEVAKQVAADFGRVDILVHAIANGPEVSKPLLQTSRKGYLSAVSSSAYSFVSMVQRFGPFMPAGGAVLSLTYIASEKVIPGYGGGMSSAKAALESDTRTLAFEAGRQFGIRINAISAGPLKSRAASAISRPVGGGKPFIDLAIAYNEVNSPLARPLAASEVADSALFLLSPMSRAVTGTVLYVDNGMHCMGMVPDSKSLQNN